MTRRRAAVALSALGLVLVGGAVWGITSLLRPPTFTCSTPDADACSNTRASILFDPKLVFAEPLPARLVAVDVRSTPPEWAMRPEYYDGRWAALLTLERGDPVLVACYYHSDEMVACNFPDDAGNPY